MFWKLIKSITILSVVAICFTSCGEYQKVLKTEDTGKKYAYADSLYQVGKYRKSLTLWEQILPTYRGKPQAERVMYLYADAYYKLGDYYMAAYQYDRFVSSYPQSEKAEEAQYKAAVSYYEQSPSYELDQTETEKAIDQLQVFLGNYPESEYTGDVNDKVQELSLKLQKKALEVAKQYNKIGDAMHTYSSAVEAFDDFISDFPGTPFREEAFYYKLDSQYQLATKSYDVLVKNRLQKALDIYETLIKNYPSGEYRERADKIKKDIDERLQQYL